MPEIIRHEVTGWVVPDGDRGALASALDRALSDPEGSRRMGAAGRARALRHFTWERVADRVVRDLERLLGQTRREGNAV